MAKYPIFIELGCRRVVVIGAGAVAVRKAEVLSAAGARLVIVADTIEQLPAELARNKNVELVKSRYSKEYLAGAVLAIAATSNPRLNEQIYRDCQELEILCNVVDAPLLCDFFTPAVVKCGDLQIAIGTEGNCPAYAGHIRKKLEEIFTEKHGQFLAELEKLRERIIKDVPNQAERKILLGRLVDDKLFELFIESGPERYRKRAEEIIRRYQDRSGESR